MAIEISDVHLILNHFSETAALIKDQADAILQNISIGLPPQQSDVIGFNNNILNLQQTYENMRLLANQYISTENMPQKDATIHKYASLIEYQKKAIEAQIKVAREVLQRFISVKSYIEKYQAALSPYQNEATKLLNELDQGHLENIGSDVFSQSELFLCALDHEDLASDIGSTLLDKLDAYYPSDVTYGLIRKRYCIETLTEDIPIEDISSQELACTEPITEVSSTEDRLRQNDLFFETDKPKEEFPSEGLVSAATENTTQVNTENEDITSCALAVTDNSPSASPISAFSQKVINCGLLTPPDFYFGELRHHQGAGKTKKISSKIFLNELSGGYQRISKYILCTILESNCANFEKNTLPQGLDPKKLAQVLDYLFSKGYIDRYELIPGGEFYCGTNRLFHAIACSEPARFIGLKKPRPVSDNGENIEDTSISAAVRLSFLAAHSHCQEYFSDCHNYTTTSSIGTYSFVVRLFSENAPEKSIMFVGAYWPNTDECDMLLEAFQKHPDRLAQTNRLCFCGIDAEHAQKLCALILAEFNMEIPHDRLLLHSFSDQTFYTFNTLQKTEWHIPEAMTPETQAKENETTSSEAPQTIFQTGQMLVSETESVNVQSVESFEKNVPTADKSSTIEEISASEDTNRSIKISENNENEPLVFRDNDSPEEKNIPKNNPDIQSTTIKTAYIQELKSDPNNDTTDSQFIQSEESNSTLADSALFDTPEHYRESYLQMLIEDKLYCAAAYLKALAQKDPVYQAAYEQLAYAINDPMANCYYNSDNIFSIYSAQEGMDYPYYVVSAILRNYFSDQCVYDYSMQSLYGAMPEYLSCEPLLSKYSTLRETLYQLMLFKQGTQHGIDFYADYRQQKRMQFEDTLHEIREKAKGYYDNNIGNNIRETASLLQAIETKKSLFAKGSDLGLSLDIVVNDNRTDIEFIEDILVSGFIKDGECIHSDNIDNKKLDKYLDNCWDEIGKAMQPKKTRPCVGSIRNNILAMLRKIVDVLCQYVEIIRQSSINEHDVGLIRYKKERENIILWLTSLCSQLEEPGISAEETAGRHVLAATAKELLSRLNGTYKEEDHKFFYYDFLQNGWILLDESGLPELDDVSEIEEMTALKRIEKHAFGKLVDLETRLQNILEEEDDFGTAELIYEYLRAADKNISKETFDIIRQATEDIVQSNGRLESKRSTFIGDIELAECYGKFDNTHGNRKESLIQIMDYWYNVALENRNFGFFYKVTDAILKKVNKDAEIRKGSLLSHLNSYKNENSSWEERENVPIIIKEIERRIELQNYAAAEDLLNRLKANDLPIQPDLDFYDYLNDFMNEIEYRDNLRSAGTTGNALAFKIINPHNSDAKQAKKLLDNWPSGNSIKVKEISVVLSTLGFDIENVTPKDPIQRANTHYVVTLKQPKNGQSSNYKHPVYAFGSEAERDGFRVVNSFGKLDADKIIGLCRDIGTEMNTLILLDCPLTLSERRILAYKMKIEHFSKAFLVLDRVALIYLAKHYNANNIQKMLMSITLPFSYYQPYISSSSTVMPSELFIGRRENLDAIKSATGPNIVYGGRQLGKSALLRMAQKATSDREESGKRAILIDINRKNAADTAKAISTALFREGIITQEEITNDWDMLADKISDYLHFSRISYFLLLLDEADAFIESCMGINYTPIIALKNIQTNYSGRFKFVLAGLRNVVRLNPDIALGDNSVLPHLKHITVKPFRSYEARELLELPLSYLGFRFPKDAETDMLISNIFSETNYFPGLLQLFCSKLIEALRRDYGNYDKSNTPPYIVTKTIIKKVLADEDLRTEIKNKFDITLRVGGDHYYYVIALLGAYHYHNQDAQNGFSVENIRNLADEFNISLITRAPINQIRALMDEMMELNILQRVDNIRYRFARYNFYQMIGSNREIEDNLMQYMEG